MSRSKYNQPEEGDKSSQSVGHLCCVALFLSVTFSPCRCIWSLARSPVPSSVVQDYFSGSGFSKHSVLTGSQSCGFLQEVQGSKGDEEWVGVRGQKKMKEKA